ncbi:MAG: regulatory protein RecX [Tannerellaceae bacterium]
MKKEITEGEALHRYAAYCSKAERCIYDVSTKLNQTTLDQEAKERIIARLLKEKFIDEDRFCRCFVNDKNVFNKWGKTKIRMELKRRHISSDLIERHLSQINTEAYTDELSRMLQKKKEKTTAKNQYDLQNKLIRYGLSRGYEMSQVIQCLKQLDHESNLDIEEYME